MARRKKEWNEGLDNLFNPSVIAQIEAINQRLEQRSEDEKIATSTKNDTRVEGALETKGAKQTSGSGRLFEYRSDGMESLFDAREMRGAGANSSDYGERGGVNSLSLEQGTTQTASANSDGRPAQGFSPNASSDRADRASGVSSGLDNAGEYNPPRSDIRSQTEIQRGRRSELLSNDDTAQMVQTLKSDGSRRDDERGLGAIQNTTSTGSTKQLRDASLFDSSGSGDERSGQYGHRDITDFGDRSIQGAKGDDKELSKLENRDDGLLRTSVSDLSEISDRLGDVYEIKSTGINQDFKATNEVLIKGSKDKFKKNIAAIKLAKELNKVALDEKGNLKPNFTITKEEQEILAGFSGWGAIPEAFNSDKENWQKEYKELKELLTKDEYQKAKSSIQDAFYTPKLLIDSMQKALNHMGLNNDENQKDILEPSSGIGNFLAFDNEQNHNFTAIELDKLSYQICKYLNPNQNILNMGFQEYEIQKSKKFDAIIGNPPFSKEARLYDKELKAINGSSIHNFFISKATNLLKDDGLMAFVISSNFLDAKDNQTREYIADKASFLGALRMPSGTFKNAGTEVVTDIVFFKNGVDPNLNKQWLNTQNFKQSEHLINEYFVANPQNVLGKLSPTIGKNGEILGCFEDSNIDIQKQIERFISELPRDIYKFKPQEKRTDIFEIDYYNPKYQENIEYYDNLKDGNLLEFDGQIYQKLSNNTGAALTLKALNLSKIEKQRVRKFIPLRDTYNQLITLEKSDIADDDIKLLDTRAKLNQLYDAYHENGDFLHNARKNRYIKEDIEAQKIIALEANYTKAISAKEALKKGLSPKNESATKANILKQRAIRPNVEFAFNNTTDGLIASMNKFGKVDIDYIASGLNKNSEQVEQELTQANLIFLDPFEFQNGNKEYIISAKYLSGNVRQKLKIASEVAKEHKEINHNVSALLDVLPKDISPSDIAAPFGAPWIPLEFYHQFFEKQFGITRENWQLHKSELNGSWSFKGYDYSMSHYNRNKFAFYHHNSRQSLSVFEIAEAALMRKSIKITKDSETETIINNKGEIVPKKVIDVIATQQVAQKMELMRNLFDEWIMDDPKRRESLAQIYNDKFNCYVKKNYDGEKLNIKGLNSAYKLRKHQLNAVSRAINERVCLFDHEVGAGKTLSSICSVIEQKRLGLINKPLIAVPNHLISQWETEFMNAYPDANLLISEEKSTSPENRDEFFAKIANGEYDAIIITHSQLEKLPVPYEITQKVIGEQIAELEESVQLKNKEKETTSKTSLKRLEARITGLKEKLKNITDITEKTKLLDFSDLGIDCLVVDESHMYKNLPFSTSLDKIKGLGNPAGSAKAINLLEKTTYLNDNGKKIIFLTGTPVSNSLTELYAVQRFLAPDELKEAGIYSFDSWAATFAKIESTFELDASAQKYQAVSRFSQFNNLPEISNAYLNFSDIVTNDDIKKYYDNYVPEVEIVKSLSPRSQNVSNYIGVQDENGAFNKGSIIYRMENMPSDPRIDNYLKCTSDAKKAGLDFRLIDPNAEDDPKSKINNCVQNIYDEYLNWQVDKGTQLVFLDIGTPKAGQSSASIDIEQNKQTQSDFSNINEVLEIDEDDIDVEAENDRDDGDTFFLYGDLYKKLVEKGIPREQIAFIHDTGGSNSKKQELFAKVNSGEVRVLIGSTAKMGAGTNVQERVTAIHHIDVPWKPSDFVQRNGRVIRQGNKLFARDPKNFKIKEFRYVTEQTYDAVSWQIIENKTKSIVNFRKGVIGSERTLSGFDEDVASVAEMKAIATGNPLMLTHIQIKTALDKEEITFKEFQKEKHRAEDTITNNEAKIKYLQEQIQTMQDVAKVSSEHTSENFQCGVYDVSLGKLIAFDIAKDDSEATKIAQEKLSEAFKQNVKLLFEKPNEEVDFIKFKGLKVSGYYEESLKQVVFEINGKEGSTLVPPNLTYKQQDRTMLIKDDIKLGGFFKRLNNYLGSLEESISKAQNQITDKQNEISAMKQFLKENESYPRLELLHALRSDENAINRELNISASNKEYKSKFVARSLQMKTELEKSKNTQNEFELI